MSGPDLFDSLLRSMEALVVACRGGFRSHLRALQFGGAAKLARELTSFLNTGAIHRDKVFVMQFTALLARPPSTLVM
jgi:hypothetical protein